MDVIGHFLSKRWNVENCQKLEQRHYASFLELRFAATVMRCEEDVSEFSHKKNEPIQKGILKREAARQNKVRN